VAADRLPVGLGAVRHRGERRAIMRLVVHDSSPLPSE
jgi:hypothetical protein